MLISEEYRQELFEYFPRLPNKDIYYQLTKHVTQSFVEKSNTFRELDIVNLETTFPKWRLPFSVLKRIDVLQTAWSSSKEMSIKGFLDYPIFSDQGVTVNDWLWQERSKYLPSIEVPSYPVISQSNITHDKLKLMSNQLLDRLKQLTDILNTGRFSPPSFFSTNLICSSFNARQTKKYTIIQTSSWPIGSHPDSSPSKCLYSDCLFTSKTFSSLETGTKSKT
ncbi:unnamed protein product [Rhizopus stolonifer]